MLIAVFRLLGRLPLAWLHRAGVALGWLAYWSAPVYARRLRENATGSGVCAGEGACRELIRAAIAETGKSVAELPAVWFGEEERVERFVSRCDDWPVVERALALGRGIIFLTPHLGCFEIAALYGARRMPLTILYRPPRKRWLDPLMAAGRGRWQARLAPANLRGVRMLYKALGRGEAVGMLPDQAPGAGEGAWADFFGRPAYTMTLAGRLQRRSGAAVIMAFAERLAEGRGYWLHLAALGPGALDETALNRAIESQIRRCPAQYLWGYNRYKVPAGAPPHPQC
ncbi:MAG: lysophospholipid acyltransferase family protein [Burkholderiales bacterium]|nr:lysophospholipid acyltransferase family protein [Burkholderiales bacterium]